MTRAGDSLQYQDAKARWQAQVMKPRKVRNRPFVFCLQLSGYRQPAEAIPGWHYLSNTTCLIQASFVLRRFICYSRVNDRHNLPIDSSLLKKTCVRQVVLDKWFPLKANPQNLLTARPTEPRTIFTTYFVSTTVLFIRILLFV